MKKIIQASAVSLALSFSLNTIAAPVTVEAIIADWSSHTGGANVVYTDADGNGGSESISWGIGSNKSSYTFDAYAPPAFIVDTDVEFNLGTFSHANFPINLGTAITSAALNITMDLNIGGTSTNEGPFSFNFIHNETPNACIPYPFCSNDLVSFQNLVTSDTFSIDGMDYTLEILGFRRYGVLTESFSTVENFNNHAQLVGVFRAPATQVPEPSSLALLALGLFGVGAARRRINR